MITAAIQNETAWTLMSTMIGALIAGLIGLLTVRHAWSMQIKHQRRMMALGFLLEIQRLKPMLQGFSNIYAQAQKGEGPFSDPKAVAIESPLYNRDGLYYYAVQKEIYFFPPDLAESLYTFYMCLIEAESTRQQTQAQALGPLQPFRLETVLTCIQRANNSIPHLEQLLAKER